MIHSKTYIAIPPGETIKEILEDRHISQKEFAKRMNMSEKHISKLLNGEVLLTQDVAMRLGMVLGANAHFWNNLEAIYREKIILAEEENRMDKDKSLVNKYPYKEMSKNNWITDTNKKEEKVINLRKFFEVVRLANLSEDLLPKIIAKKQKDSEKNNYCLIVFAQKAKLEARNIKTEPINIKKLNNNIPKIKEFINKDPKVFKPKLTELLSKCGIALVLLPQLGKANIHGVTFLDKHKIVIGIPLEEDNSKFWHNLFHELGHIILGHLYKDSTTKEDETNAEEWAKDNLK